MNAESRKSLITQAMRIKNLSKADAVRWVDESLRRIQLQLNQAKAVQRFTVQ